MTDKFDDAAIHAIAMFVDCIPKDASQAFAERAARVMARVIFSSRPTIEKSVEHLESRCGPVSADILKLLCMAHVVAFQHWYLEDWAERDPSSVSVTHAVDEIVNDLLRLEGSVTRLQNLRINPKLGMKPSHAVLVEKLFECVVHGISQSSMTPLPEPFEPNQATMRLRALAEKLEAMTMEAGDDLSLGRTRQPAEVVLVQSLAAIWKRATGRRATAAKNTSTGHVSPFYAFLCDGWDELNFGSAPSIDKVAKILSAPSLVGLPQIDNSISATVCGTA